MRRSRSGLLFAGMTLALLVLAGACSRSEAPTAPAATPRARRAAKGGTMQLTSSAFAGGAAIPAKYTCDGQDVSPPLKWSGVPEGAKSLALICDDPDAPSGTWVHWVVYDLPPSVGELPEGVPAARLIPPGGRQGTNDFKRPGYGGPCPPPGNPHRYFFKLYALDTELRLPPGASKADLERAMPGHILAQGELMGTYRRK